VSEPVWLLRTAILSFHHELLADFGGASGIRDEGMLDSALMRPVNKWHYGEADIAKLAASYAYGIAMNHPFVDGNKRTAFMALMVFLLENGWKLTATQAEATHAILELAAGKVSEDSLAKWISDHSVKV
jgi:death-on-curing protein